MIERGVQIAAPFVAKEIETALDIGQPDPNTIVAGAGVATPGLDAPKEETDKIPNIM